MPIGTGLKTATRESRGFANPENSQSGSISKTNIRKRLKNSNPEGSRLAQSGRVPISPTRMAPDFVNLAGSQFCQCGRVLISPIPMRPNSEGSQRGQFGRVSKRQAAGVSILPIRGETRKESQNRHFGSVLKLETRRIATSTIQKDPKPEVCQNSQYGGVSKTPLRKCFKTPNRKDCYFDNPEGSRSGNLSK